MAAARARRPETDRRVRDIIVFYVTDALTGRFALPLELGRASFDARLQGRGDRWRSASVAARRGARARRRQREINYVDDEDAMIDMVVLHNFPCIL
ncbi:hypothetical protein EVAR_3682_1 [Eumeta japonica]|uniref:Uncharacterized protein n=1 Tax=Eumeta variegata TaxID=151549 RepID=A0A4C1SRY1_EUMVA|nr:hypothetical protein EVAR_3682_1 [Eumeta japonica]